MSTLVTPSPLTPTVEVTGGGGDLSDRSEPKIVTPTAIDYAPNPSSTVSPFSSVLCGSCTLPFPSPISRHLSGVAFIRISKLFQHD